MKKAQSKTSKWGNYFKLLLWQLYLLNWLADMLKNPLGDIFRWNTPEQQNVTGGSLGELFSSKGGVYVH